MARQFEATDHCGHRSALFGGTAKSKVLLKGLVQLWMVRVDIPEYKLDLLMESLI